MRKLSGPCVLHSSAEKVPHKIVRVKIKTHLLVNITLSTAVDQFFYERSPRLYINHVCLYIDRRSLLQLGQQDLVVLSRGLQALGDLCAAAAPDAGRAEAGDAGFF